MALLDRLEEVERDRQALKRRAEVEQMHKVEVRLESRCAALDAQLEAAQLEISQQAETIEELEQKIRDLTNENADLENVAKALVSKQEEDRSRLDVMNLPRTFY